VIIPFVPKGRIIRIICKIRKKYRSRYNFQVWKKILRILKKSPDSIHTEKHILSLMATVRFWLFFGNFNKNHGFGGTSRNSIGGSSVGLVKRDAHVQFPRFYYFIIFNRRKTFLRRNIGGSSLRKEREEPPMLLHKNVFFRLKIKK